LTLWNRIEQFFKHRCMRLAEDHFGRRVLTPREVDWKRVHRVLIIRQQDQLGDFLLSTPAIRAVRDRFPSAHIGIVVKDYFAGAMQNSPFVDDLLVFCKKGRDWTAGKFLSLWEKLYGKWDFAVVLSSESHSLTSDMLALLSGARWILGSARSPYGGCRRNFMYNLLAPDSPPSAHQSARNLDIVRTIGAESNNLHETVHITAGEKEEISRRFPELYGGPRPIVGFHIGANKMENRWPAARFAALRETLHQSGLDHLVVFWGPAEKDLGSEFLRLLRSPVHAVEPENLREQAVHFSLCDAVVCNDTGVMHLCASVGTPLVAVFGPTDPEFWKPPGDSFIALRSRDRKMEGVSVGEVKRALFQILGKGRVRK